MFQQKAMMLNFQYDGFCFSTLLIPQKNTSIFLKYLK